MARRKKERGKVFLTLVMIGIAALIFYSASRKSTADIVSRTFSKTENLDTSETITVTYEFAPAIADNAWAVHEELPSGWTFEGVAPLYPSEGLNSYEDSGSTVIRFEKEGADNSKIVLQFKAPDQSGEYVFEDGEYWTVNRPTFVSLGSQTVTVVGCSPVDYDGDGNCEISSGEFASVVADWLTGDITNTVFASYGNVYFSGGLYEDGNI